MARRNRKKKKVNTFAFPVPFAGVVILVVVFALAYVWLGGRCDALGTELKDLEKERAILEKRYSNEASRWALMKSPESIEQALEKWKIVMGYPRSDQVVWIYDTGIENKQVAAVASPRRGRRPPVLRQGYVGAVMNE